MRKIAALSMALFFAVALSGCGEQTARQEEAGEMEGAKDTMSAEQETGREDFMMAMNERVEDIGREIHDFKTEVDRAQLELSAEMREELQGIEKSGDDLRRRLAELKNVAENQKERAEPRIGTEKEGRL